MASLTLRIDGMSCGHCVNAVSRSLSEVPGVRVREVTIGTATIEYDPEQTSEATVVQAVADAGYPAKRADRP
jgi:copper chaperone